VCKGQTIPDWTKGVCLGHTNWYSLRFYGLPRQEHLQSHRGTGHWRTNCPLFGQIRSQQNPPVLWQVFYDCQPSGHPDGKGPDRNSNPYEQQNSKGVSLSPEIGVFQRRGIAFWNIILHKCDGTLVKLSPKWAGRHTRGSRWASAPASSHLVSGTCVGCYLKHSVYWVNDCTRHTRLHCA